MSTGGITMSQKELDRLSIIQQVKTSTWVEPFMTWEETERTERSLACRLKSARLGRFKHISDFDCSWPKQCDREAIENWLRLSFIKEATNLILSGPNDVGKSTIARSIAHQAILEGHTALDGDDEQTVLRME